MISSLSRVLGNTLYLLLLAKGQCPDSVPALPRLSSDAFTTMVRCLSPPQTTHHRHLGTSSRLSCRQWPGSRGCSPGATPLPLCWHQEHLLSSGPLHQPRSGRRQPRDTLHCLGSCGQRGQAEVAACIGAAACCTHGCAGTAAKARGQLLGLWAPGHHL